MKILDFLKLDNVHIYKFQYYTVTLLLIFAFITMLPISNGLALFESQSCIDSLPLIKWLSLHLSLIMDFIIFCSYVQFMLTFIFLCSNITGAYENYASGLFSLFFFGYLVLNLFLVLFGNLGFIDFKFTDVYDYFFKTYSNTLVFGMRIPAVSFILSQLINFGTFICIIYTYYIHSSRKKTDETSPSIHAI